MQAELKSKDIYTQSDMIWIDTEKIMPNRSQPRTVFDAEALNELAESIKKYGILQPLSVRSNPEKSEFSSFQYELIAGERRLRAAKLLGIKKVPCILIESDTKTSAALAIIENLHRKDLNIFEEAYAIASLIKIYKLTQEQVAAKLSITQAAIANKLRLLKLNEDHRALITNNELTERHARAIIRIKSENMRTEALKYIIAHNLNVKQTEELVAKKLGLTVSEEKNPGISGKIGKNNAKSTDIAVSEWQLTENKGNIIETTTTFEKNANPFAYDHSNQTCPTDRAQRARRSLVFNLDKQIEQTRSKGIRVKTQQTETDSEIIYTITIPK